MRKFATTALTALSITLMGSAAALADAPNKNAPYQGPGYNQPHTGSQGQWNQGPRSGGYVDERYDERFDDRYDQRFDRRHDRRFDDRRFNFQLHFGNAERWERGWGHGNWSNQYRFHQPLNHWRLIRQLERQGFYGVRGLQKARWGFGYRAFAFNFRGQPVILRINPYTGRVMDVRYI
jgi:hypothetical protein